MPVLPNPRYEAFAQAIFAGLSRDGSPYSQGRAYIAAGYRAKDAGKTGGSAEVCASKLLKKAKPIIDRVRELQAESNARLKPQIDFSRERVGRRLHLASEMAERLEKPTGIAVNELGIARVFGHIKGDDEPSKTDFTTANSMEDIGRKLLQSVGVGFASPDDVSIQAAIEANDAFIARLEAIRDGAQGLTINQGTD
jgi:hypothetical protein